MIQDGLLEWRFSAILLLEVIVMTDSVDWERELMRARELMVQTSRDTLDDAAKIQIFLEACSLAESLVYGHRIGDHARSDLQAYAERMRQDGALDCGLAHGLALLPPVRWRAVGASAALC